MNVIISKTTVYMHTFHIQINNIILILNYYEKVNVMQTFA
jgi:hypothetical protein